MFRFPDTVRVVQLLVPTRDVLGSVRHPSQPAVGETGTVVFEYPDGSYAVERVAPDGMTVWLADFEAAELELVHRP